MPSTPDNRRKHALPRISDPCRVKDTLFNQLLFCDSKQLVRTKIAVIGNRNAVTLSNTAYWNRRNVSRFYWSADFTDFTSDGVLPSITSRDGWTNTVGLSHAFYPECWYLYKFRFGVDLQFADLEGSDFSYNGVNLYTEANIPLTQTVSLILELGWGYRDYFDFEFTPSRNENIWRGSLELEKQLNDSLTAAVVFNYDRFDSENVLFEADRFVTGVVLRYEF